ncbi:hypothetical protein [Paractinoplanes maris]|uniref:hypothetical protein n=1 Tax=Paractinoplanes maris TaxID=1734446 RepID=UPI00202117AD|nr:hypothetical protein [Actinoplanes maris]
MNDLRAAAAAVIEPFLTGNFKRAERATGIATSLDNDGHLLGATPRTDARERVANDLGCRMDWPVAEKAAAALDGAGLLANDNKEN